MKPNNSREDPEELFESFLKEEYREKIARLGLEGKRSLVVDFDRLIGFSSDLAESVRKKPDEYLTDVGKEEKIAERALRNCLRIEDPSYLNELDSSDPPKRLHVRLKNLPETTPLKKIGEETRNTLCAVVGQVKHLSISNKPLIVKLVFRCRYCGEVTSVIQQVGQLYVKEPVACPNPACGRKNFELYEDDDNKVDSVAFLTFTISDARGRWAYPVYLFDDLKETKISLGARIKATVIPRYFILKKSRPPTAKIYLVAQYVEPADVQPLEIDQKTLREIKEYVSHDYMNAFEIIQSVHPLSAIPYFLTPAFLYASAVCSMGAWDEKNNVRRTINIDICGFRGLFKTATLEAIQKILGDDYIGSGSGGGVTKGGLLPTVVRSPQEDRFEVYEGLLSKYDGKLLIIDDAHALNVEEKRALCHIETGRHVMAKYGQHVPFSMKESLILLHNWADIDYSINKSWEENLNLPPDLLDRLDAVYEFEPPPPEIADEVMIERRSRQQKGEPLTKIPRAWLPVYFLSVMQFYRQGGFTIPPEIKEKANELWFQMYRYFYTYRAPDDETRWKYCLNIRSRNSVDRFLQMLAAMHYRKNVIWDDWLFVKERILELIPQLKRPPKPAFEKATINLESTALQVITESKEKELDMKNFIEKIHHKLMVRLDEDEAERLLPSEPLTLDHNTPLRTLIKNLKPLGQEHGFTILSKPKLGTKILISPNKNYIGSLKRHRFTRFNRYNRYTGLSESNPDPQQFIISAIRQLQDVNPDGKGVFKTELEKRINMPKQELHKRLENLMEQGLIFETSPGRIRSLW